MNKNSSNILVIIVTYNGEKWINKCVKSVLNSNIEVDILIIDNKSTDSTLNLIDFKEFQIVIKKLNYNLGFGKANNIGLKYALDKGYKNVFLLNQDCYIEQNTLSELVKFSKENRQFGIISPMQYNGSGTYLDKNFRTQLKNVPNEVIFGNTIFEINFVNASGWFIPSEIVRSIGGFDPIFPHYGEDNDFSNRVLMNGYKIGIVPYIKYFHDRIITKDFVNRKKQFMLHFAKHLLFYKMNGYNSMLLKSSKGIYWALRNVDSNMLLIELKSLVRCFGLKKEIKKHRSQEKSKISNLYLDEIYNRGI